MKKLITLAAGVLLTSTAFANTVTINKTTNLSTAEYTTKAAAIDAAFDITEQLSGNSQSELRNEFRIVTENSVRNIAILDTEVKTEEFARTRDDVKYRAIVNVNYQFDTRDND
ncbi:DUF3316 domain-containing protein [Psychromonas sp. PT13]|uniref:DUF3316 domain-containing protein n=1 Tax=Psychromonas sp. PT13 TaxID=3439547 RepID=UPI003EBE274B